MDCPYCNDPKCDCLCNVCVRTKILNNVPDWYWEASWDTKTQYMQREMERMKGGKSTSLPDDNGTLPDDYR